MVKYLIISFFKNNISICTKEILNCNHFTTGLFLIFLCIPFFRAFESLWSNVKSFLFYLAMWKRPKRCLSWRNNIEPAKILNDFLVHYRIVLILNIAIPITLAIAIVGRAIKVLREQLKKKQKIRRLREKALQGAIEKIPWNINLRAPMTFLILCSPILFRRLVERWKDLHRVKKWGEEGL